jgi:LysR family nitrogen assimilation transcriptional regulator
MRAVASRYANDRLHLNEELTGNMVDQLLGGRVDMALFTNTMPARDIDFVPLVEEAFVLMHSAQDAFAPGLGDVSLDEALARPLVVPSPQHGHCTRRVVDEALKRAGRPPQRVAAEINSVYVLKSAVEAGIGPSIMPLGLAQREVEDGRLIAHRIASADMVRTLGLCTSRHLSKTNARRAVCKLIEDVVRDLYERGQRQTLAMAADQNAPYEQYRRPTRRDVFLATMGADRAVGCVVQRDRAALPQGR